MNSRRWLVPGLSVLALAGVLVWGNARRAPQPVFPRDRDLKADASALRAPYDPKLIQRNLQFWAGQTKTDEKDPLSRAQLAHWYLESYRETGDNADITRAEQAALASLKLRPSDGALLQLSRVWLNQHRFKEALQAAQHAAVVNPDGTRLVADIQYELGDYVSAEKNAHRAPPQGDDPAFYALLSRFSELKGDSKSQLELLTKATQQADASLDAGAQSISWFHERLGRAYFMNGQLDEAARQYRRALEVFPRDYRSMVALARLEAARNHPRAALEWGEKAAAIVPAPDTLALLGDAYLALGQTEKARAQFALVDKIGALSVAQGVLYDRQRAMYYADHDLKPAVAVELARGELKVRHDIYAYDTLAWTLFKAGQKDEAAVNMQKALQWGTRDASLWFHKGMIAAARGQKNEARRDLELALQINPQFHATQPQVARAALKKLGVA